MDSRQYRFFVFSFGLKDSSVLESLFLKSVIPGPTIGSNGATGSNIIGHERNQFLCRTSSNDLHSKPAQLLSFPLNSDCYSRLKRRATAFFATYASKIEFVYFDKP